MSRTLNVVRMQLVNRQTFVWVPLIIIAGAWLISYLIYAIIGAGIGDTPARGEGFNGASQAPLWYFLAIGIQSLTLTFPFSQAMSVTRRTFFLGTTLVTAGAGAVVATLFTLLTIPELATSGWGVGSYMFAMPWVTDGPWYHGWIFFFAVTVLFFMLGFWSATIYKRFGTAVLTTALVAGGLAVVGAIAVITWQQWWPAVGGWLAQQSSGAIGGWLLAVALVLGVSSYLTLRRATP